MSAGDGSAADSSPPARTPVGPGGLCPVCSHVRILTSARGSTFLLCQKYRTDERFPRYPAQPKLSCPGFQQ